MATKTKGLLVWKDVTSDEEKELGRRRYHADAGASDGHSYYAILGYREGIWDLSFRQPPVASGEVERCIHLFPDAKTLPEAKDICERHYKGTEAGETE